MENTINDLLVIRRCISAMRFGVDEVQNVAYAKTATDYIDKRVAELREKEEKHEQDVSDNGNG